MSILSRSRHRSSQPPLQIAPDDKSLRPRHRDVLMLAAQGLTQQQSAKRLDVSRHTVEAHLTEARKRLDATNTAHAVAVAIATGQLEVSA